MLPRIHMIRRIAAPAAAALVVCLPACDGGKEKAGNGESKLAKAGFKQAPDAGSSDGPQSTQDMLLPPEQLWSPRELGFGKKGSKKCFPRSEKEYSMILARAGDLTVSVADFTAIFHTYTLDSTKDGKDTLETRRKLLGELIDQELLALSARRKGYESKQVGSLLQKRELADMIRADFRKQAMGEISEEAYKKYYRTHPKKYMIHPDQRRVVKIIIKPKKSAQKLIKKFRDEKASIKEFSKAARSISLDPAAKDTSGRTAWFDREGLGADGHVLPMKIAQAAFKLKKKGDIHPSALPSSKGWHVIMFLSSREEKWTPYHKVRASIVSKFVSERQKVLTDKLLDTMKKTHPVSVYVNLLEKVSPVPCL
jgi:hypothetical protein